jgi:hypothetical protein
VGWIVNSVYVGVRGVFPGLDSVLVGLLGIFPGVFPRLLIMVCSAYKRFPADNDSYPESVFCF